MRVDVTTLVLIPLLAVLAPLIARIVSHWVRIPIVVFELVLGIIAGPAVLHIAHSSDFVNMLSQFGLAMLFFVAGTEIELRALRSRTGIRAGYGWLISLAAGVVIGLVVAPGGAPIIIGVALCSTALGTLLPIMRDAGELTTPFGRAVGAVGAVGEFGPLLTIALLLSGRAADISALTLLAFAAVAALALWWALAVPQGGLHRAVNATLHTSAQYAVRVVILILAALVALSLTLGIDMLLGAFTAGVVWRVLMREADEHDREAVESKIEAVAFGFFVPIFFIYTGVTFDLKALLDNPLLLALVPAVAAVLLIVRGIPSMLAAPAGCTWRERIAVGLMGATALPIIVVVTGIGVSMGTLPSAAAAVLVGAGMLSVLLFPLIGMGIRRPQSAHAVDAQAAATD